MSTVNPEEVPLQAPTSAWCENNDNTETIKNKTNSSRNPDNRIEMDGEASSKNCCRIWSKLCWWIPPEDETSPGKEFFLETSIHGLKYVGQRERHLTERIFWILSFVVGCFAAFWLIKDIWWKYYDSPIIVTFQPFQTTVDQIPFPAITICNMNKLQKSEALPYLQNYENLLSHSRDEIGLYDELPVYFFESNMFLI